MPCKLRGNCEACIVKNKEEGTMAHCMEKVAEEYGAKLPLRYPATKITKDVKAMSKATAKIVKEVLQKTPDALLCFPAGSTVIGTCEKLKKMVENKEIDFSQAKFVALDEWVGLEEGEEDCTYFLTKHLYEPLKIKPENMRMFNTKAEDLQAECKQVDEYIFAQGGIDLMILGIGMNGHLGLNEPYDDFDSYAKVVELSETTKKVGQKYFKSPTKLTKGITLGVRHIFETKKVILQISGAAKKDIVYDMYQSQPGEEIPATVMKLLTDGEVIMDEAAAQRVADLIDK